MIVFQRRISLPNRVSCGDNASRFRSSGKFGLSAGTWLAVLYGALISNLFVVEEVKAQDRLELGGFVGTSYYLGDFNPGTPFVKPGLALGALARYVVNDRWALKGAFTVGGISGNYPREGLLYVADDGDSYSFKRKISDVALTTEFNFLSYDHHFLTNTVFTPYVTFGLASTVYSRFDAESPTSGTGTTVFVLSLPFGLGVKYKITKWMRIGAEWTLRKTFVDDLDYTGNGSSVDPTDPYGFDKKSAVHNNDWYSFAGVSLSFNMLKRKVSCNSGY